MTKKRVGIEIKKLVNQFKRHLRDLETRIDGLPRLTEMQREVIGFLFEQRDKKIVYQKNIEEEFNIRRSTATGILKLMEKHGLIIRETDASDARWKKITLTEKSVKIVHQVHAELQNFEKTITRGIPRGDLETFFAVLERIDQNIR